MRLPETVSISNSSRFCFAICSPIRFGLSRSGDWRGPVTAALTEVLHGIRILLLPAEGPKLRTARDATDVMSEAFSQSASWLAIPISRLDDDFFRLRTGVAGEIVSKFTGYGMSAAFLGDISQHIANSDSFRDFVREANRGRGFWFVADLEELSQRFAKAQSRAAPEAGS
jgi:Domain of unknown function (DUF4180)